MINASVTALRKARLLFEKKLYNVVKKYIMKRKTDPRNF